MILTLAILVGCILDVLFGDPLRIPHPVVWMGRCISMAERFLRKKFSPDPKGELAAGRILAVCLSAAVFAVTFGICRLCRFIHPALYFLVEAFWCFQALAARSLAVEAEDVKKELKRAARSSGETGLTGQSYEESEQEGRSFGIEENTSGKAGPEPEKNSYAHSGRNLDRARAQVSRIVGRDTDQMDEVDITRACVESVAENASDGVIAPLFFMLIGGAPLAMTYKAVNTMDSMVGYRNRKYLYFGRAAAKLDDIANFLPSRICALFWIASAFFDPHSDGRNAWKIFRRDRRKHASPNSAQTESACAGALHIRLAGPASYFGERVEKPYIGDDDRPIEAEDISRSVRLMWISYGIALAVGIGNRLLIFL